MAVAGVLDVLLRLEHSGFTRGVQNASRQARRMGHEMQKVGRSITTLAAPLGAAAAGAILLANRAGKAADELLDLEQKTGITTSALQEFRRVANVAGVAADTVADAAQRLTTRLSATGEESASVQRAFRALGVSTKNADGSLRSMDSLLPDIIRSLQSMGDITTRNALAADIFGRGASELAPILGMTATEFDNAREEAHKLGLVLSRDALEAANRFRKSWDTARQSLVAAATNIGIAVMPAVQALVDLVQRRVVPAVQGFVRWLDHLDDRVKIAALAIAGLAVPLGLVVTWVGKLTVAINVLVPMLAKATALLVAGNPVLLALAVAAGLAAGAIWFFGRRASEAAREAEATRRQVDELTGALDDMTLAEARRREEVLRGSADVLRSVRAETQARLIAAEAAEADVRGGRGAEGLRVFEEARARVDLLRQGVADLDRTIADLGQAGDKAAAHIQTLQDQLARDDAARLALETQALTEQQRRLAESSAQVVADLALRRREEERLAAALAVSREAGEAEAGRIERERSLRQMLTGVISQHEAEARKLAEAILDSLDAQQALDEQYRARQAQERAIADLEREVQELRHLVAAYADATMTLDAINRARFVQQQLQRAGVDAASDEAQRIRELAEEWWNLNAAISGTARAREDEAAAGQMSAGGAVIRGAAGQVAGAVHPMLGAGVSGFLAGGPVGAAAAVVSGIVGGLLRSGRRAREAAEAAERAWQQAVRRLQDFGRNIGPLESALRDLDKILEEAATAAGMSATAFLDLLQEEAALIHRIEEVQRDIERLEETGFFDRETMRELERTLAALNQQLGQTQALTSGYREALERLAANFRQELEVRALIAQGMTKEAAALRLRISHEKELADAIAAGLDQVTIARLREVQAMEEQALANQEAADAIRQVSSALNAPAGLRLSLLEWRASVADVADDVADDMRRMRDRLLQRDPRDPRDLIPGPGDFEPGAESLEDLLRNRPSRESVAAVEDAALAFAEVMDAALSSTASTLDRFRAAAMAPEYQVPDLDAPNVAVPEPLYLLPEITPPVVDVPVPRLDGLDRLAASVDAIAPRFPFGDPSFGVDVPSFSELDRSVSRTTDLFTELNRQTERLSLGAAGQQPVQQITFGPRSIVIDAKDRDPRQLLDAIIDAAVDRANTTGGNPFNDILTR